jgi:hypothetical protein
MTNPVPAVLRWQFTCNCADQLSAHRLDQRFPKKAFRVLTNLL